MIAIRRRALAREFMEARGHRFGFWPTNRVVVPLFTGSRAYGHLAMTPDERTFKRQWLKQRIHLGDLRTTVRCDRSPNGDAAPCQSQPKRDGSNARKRGNASANGTASRTSQPSGFAS